jgi:NAD(P)-dependent dehydrogenase (short-subunit alcohol dehydrogenase family)
MTTSDPRVAIVTGGSQGIGWATVKAFAARGMSVVAAARDGVRLNESIAALDSAHRGQAVGMIADVSDEADVKALVGKTIERFGRIDVLVNSAGVSMSARPRVVQTTSEEWHKLINTNLTGTYLMCREALPHLERVESAYVLNIQSTASYASQPGVSLYAASKYGVRALTEALIEEYRDTGVRVSSVSPGPVDTTIWNHKIEPPSADRRAKMLRPSDIADIVVWLLDRPHHMHIPNITVTPWTRI